MSYQPKERPIIFSAPMVRAILEGRKTQTRRIIKPQPKIIHSIYGDASIDTERIFRQGDQRIHCPYGRPGDRLWVREAFAEVGCIGRPIDWFEYNYRADFENGQWEGYADMCFEKWRPSIHMPRAASRILLEITEIRVERACDISEADAIAEGAQIAIQWMDGRIENVDEAHIYHTLATHKLGFQYIWQSINGPESWNINPWVWVITFNRITP